MKDLQQSTLLERGLDFRAARTLCRDGWSCEQINVVLKHIAISQDQFETMQAQSRELDALQKEFGAPADAMYVGHTEPSQSELDFLNRGPDAAADVLRDKGWSTHEISLVIQETMFPNMESAKVLPQQASSYSGGAAAPMVVPKAFPTQGRNGYALGHPDAGITTLPYTAASANQVQPRRGSRSTLMRDTLILAFMAGIALALVFTLL